MLLRNFSTLSSNQLRRNSFFFQRFQPFSSSISHSKSKMPRLEAYTEALKALNSLQSNVDVVNAWANARRTNLEVDLSREMESYVGRLNINLDSLSVIHVAGTKGKGSTCAFTESIIREHGYSTGLFTSPHLVSVRERIRLNGIPVSPSLFANYFWQVWNGLQQSKTEEFPSMPAYFRFLTLLALKIFQEEKVDCTILEVGVGGRTDATNIVKRPVVTGVTSLGYDHQKVLGDTLTEIAFEKSGIFKRGIPALASPQVPEAMDCLVKRAKELVVDPPFNELLVIQDSPSIENVSLGLAGHHQKSNASLAIALTKMWLSKREGKELSPDLTKSEKLDEKTERGLVNVDWPGRGQLVELPNSNIRLHLDGAHTPESMNACIRWFFSEVDSHKGDNLVVLIFNCSNARDPATLLKPLVEYCSETSRVFNHGIVTSNESGKSHILQKLLHTMGPSGGNNWQEEILASWNTMESNILPHPVFKTDIPSTIEYLHQLGSENPQKKIQVLIAGSL
eukprot:TRINITY_DN5843_c0_g1_i1.p1 TRINITY_DN5843_c0_g1~~TRINITY_DN5843_c0_g1_i1.p1  ORF type:complete len:508 (+),score=171.21 TRINITY_DN5843_c0_g1_i1:103-1626(+)